MTGVRAQALRPVREGGERRRALALEMDRGADTEAFVASAERAIARAESDGAAFVYGLVNASDASAVLERLGWSSLGAAPLLGRPLRLSAAVRHARAPRPARALLAKIPLVSPFGRARPGVRELDAVDPRITRLWDRFSVDVGVAVERNAAWVGERVFERREEGYRTFVFEDGDRYVIRALCIFRTKNEGDRTVGEVAELLHDRSVAGMRAASHLLGLALRELLDANAEVAFAWSLPHSGSFPLFARHAFVPVPSRARAQLGVRALDPALEDVVAERRHWYLSGLDFDPV